MNAVNVGFGYRGHQIDPRPPIKERLKKVNRPLSHDFLSR